MSLFYSAPFGINNIHRNNNKDRLERLQENLTPVPQSPIVEEIGLPNFVKDQQSIAVFLGNGSEIIQILPDSIIFTKTGKIWKPLRGSKILYASRPLDESSLFCIITSEKLLIFINADTREPYAYQILNGIPSAVTCHIRSNVLEVIFSSWETDHLVYITSDEHCTSDDPLSSRQCVEKPFMFEELAYEPHRFKLTHHITALSSLLFCEGSFYLDYLFAGFGDGSIVYFPINDPLKALHVKIGNCPVRFEKLSQPNGSQMLVSISDRAFVVDGSLASLRDGEDQISKFRVTFSMYNSRVPFSSFAGFLPKGLLIMASENRILLGRMSGVSQRLNHERVQFGSTIMRVVNLDSFGLYAILQRFKDHNLNGSVALIDHETLTGKFLIHLVPFFHPLLVFFSLL